MTTSHDPVEAVLNAYFEFLEHGGVEPTLDHLNPDDRTEAQQMIASLSAGRGIDPEASRPSIAALLAAEPNPRSIGEIAQVAKQLEEGLRDRIDQRCNVVPDVAAMVAGIDSDLQISCDGHRIRGIVTNSLADLDALSPATLAATAAIFGGFGETAGVLLLAPGNNPDRLGVVVERVDLESAINVAHGRTEAPGIRRPAGDAVTVLVGFISELSPTFDQFDHSLVQGASTTSSTADLRAFAQESVAAIASQGTKARIPEKNAAWKALGDTEIGELAALMTAIEAGEAGAVSLRDWLDELAPAEAA